MKLIINQEILIEHLNYVIKGISSRNLIPILNCIKLSLKKDGLYLSSTDNEIGIQSFIDKKDLEVKELGDIVLPGRLFYEIIRKLNNEKINIDELIDSKINIYTDNSSFTLTCNNANEFPDLELDKLNDPIEINKTIFRNIINQTIFATSTQESRPVLTGINFKFENKELICTATDSYRLATKKIELTDIKNKKHNIIIPTKNLQELIRMLDEDEELLEIYIFDNKVIFKFNSIILLTRIINGAFPTTEKLIPEDFSIVLKINSKELYSAIDRASLLTNESEKNTIKFETKKGVATISSTIPEIGYVEEKIDISNDLKEEIKISFSSKYMLEALKSFDCEEINLMFNGEIKPIIIKNPSSDDLIQLILPIRTY